MLIALSQPLLRELNLVSMRGVDAPGDVDQLLAVRAVSHQRSHLKGLVMMRDHVMHEANLVRRVARFSDLNRSVGAQFLRRLALGRRAG